MKNPPKFISRFANNDPMNSEDLTRTYSYMDKLDDWLTVFTIDHPSKYLEKLNLPDETNLFARTEIESRIPFVNQRRRPNLFSEFYSVPRIFGANLSIAVGGTGNNQSGSVEDPEFFHRNISAFKIEDSRQNDILVELLDRVPIQ